MELVIFQNLYSLTNFSPLFDGLIVFLGKNLPFLAFIYFLYIIYKLNKKTSKSALRVSLFSVIAVAISSGIVLPALHFLIQRTRPFIELTLDPLFVPIRESSMPSAHATFFFLLATIALFNISTKSALWLYFSASIIAISRVIAGVHWPSDILIGAAIGIGIVLILELLAKSFTAKTRL